MRWGVVNACATKLILSPSAEVVLKREVCCGSTRGREPQFCKCHKKIVGEGSAYVWSYPMMSLTQALRNYFSEAGGTKDDSPRTVPHSRRETSKRNKRGYALYEPTPLTEDEVRRLPVPHHYSA
jgi:hypothetical protein